MTYDNRQFYIDGAWVDPVEAEGIQRHQSGHRVGRGRHFHGRPERRRPCSGRGPTRLRRLLAHDAGRAPCPHRAHPRRLQGSLRRDRPGDLDRNGCADHARQGLADPDRRRPHQRHDRGAQDLQVRGDARHDAARARAGRRVRADHALELADEPGRRQGRPGARGRLHHGAQALRVLALQRHPMGQGHARGRRARRCFQSRSTATALMSERRSRRTATSTWSRSPDRRAPAPRSPRTRPHRSSACIRNSVASRRTCCSTMPTSSAPSSSSVLHVFQNSGQSCNAPTRMLVPGR